LQFLGSKYHMDYELWTCRFKTSDREWFAGPLLQGGKYSASSVFLLHQLFSVVLLIPSKKGPGFFRTSTFLLWTSCAQQVIHPLSTGMARESGILSAWYDFWMLPLEVPV
jgi:hypothetical protein